MDVNINPVRAVREAMGWTQFDLARELNVALSTVAKWEQENRAPGGRAIRDAFAKLAKRANVEVPAPAPRHRANRKTKVVDLPA